MRTSSTTVGRPWVSWAVETTPAGLLSTCTSSGSGATGAAVDRHAALLVHVAGRIGHRLAVDPHAAFGDQVLGRAARGHARVCKELAESHAPKAARLGAVDLKLLEERLSSLGEPGFRARQVWEWAARGAYSYEDMTNLPLELRDRLSEEVPLRRSRSSARRWPLTTPGRRSSARTTRARSRRCS